MKFCRGFSAVKVRCCVAFGMSYVRDHILMLVAVLKTVIVTAFEVLQQQSCLEPLRP